VDTTALLLEWVRQSSIGVKVVGVSSAAVYGSQYSGHILESENLTPLSPYGFHKLMLETLFESYSNTFGLDLAVVRLFSVYGPGLKKQLIWDLCNKIASCNGNQIHLHGKGTEFRDWLYISDAVCLLNSVADCSSGNEKMIVVNGGSGIGITISDIAHSLVDAWGGDYKITFSGESRQGDPVSLIADVSLAKKIGFEAQVDISDGLTNVVRWYKENKF
jgi:UDP-glucose 4-epimerase